MQKSDIINKLKNLKTIQPDRDFVVQTKNRLLSYVKTYEPSPPLKMTFAFSPIFIRTGAIVLGTIFVFVLIWQLLLIPLFSPKTPSALEISTIQSEWQLADISPYLKDIFVNDLIGENVDSALTQLARQESYNFPKRAINKETIKKEAKSVILDQQLPVLNNDEIDLLLNELTF